MLHQNFLKNVSRPMKICLKNFMTPTKPSGPLLHIECAVPKFNENKISKNLGLMYKAKYYLNKIFLLVLYYSFIHTYNNYGNIAWGSINRTNILKINSLQKDAIRIIHCKSRFAHATQLLRKSKILNVFQLNILDNLVFMHQISNSTKNSFSHKQFFLWTCVPVKIHLFTFVKYSRFRRLLCWNEKSNYWVIQNIS